MKLPKAKSNDIVIMNLENETLIYDLKTNKAFCLNETAATVYQHCDGTKTFAQLSAEHKFNDDLIFFALDELRKEQLLETDENYQSPFAQMTRRAVVRKIGLASMIALPLVASVVAPVAINAGSCINPFPCAFDNYKQGNCCPGDRCDTTGRCFSCNAPGSPFSDVSCAGGNIQNFCCSGSGVTRPDGFCSCV